MARGDDAGGVAEVIVAPRAKASKRLLSTRTEPVFNHVISICESGERPATGFSRSRSRLCPMFYTLLEDGVAACRLDWMSGPPALLGGRLCWRRSVGRDS